MKPNQKNKMKRIHVVQHVSFEGPGVIADWAKERGFELSKSYVKQMESFPKLNSFDLLVLMGGPMSVNDEDRLPWLFEEKEFVRKSIAAGKKIVGICLGAQMIASALGHTVLKNRYKEIGWYDIVFNRTNILNTPFEYLPNRINVFHWHGETFELPAKASLLASSVACKNQIFMIEDNIIGLQCHLEMQAHDIKTLAEKCKDDLSPETYVMDYKEMITNAEQCPELNNILFDILDKFIE